MFFSYSLQQPFKPSLNVRSPEHSPVVGNLKSSLFISMEKLNTIVKGLCPHEYDHLRMIMDKMIEVEPGTATAHEGNPTPFASLAVLSNRITKEHTDSRCHLRGIDCIMTSGEYEGGDFLISELGVQLPYGPGTLLCFRGRAFKHSIQKWAGKDRKCICYFQWQSVIRQVGLDEFPPLAPIVQLTGHENVVHGCKDH